MAQTFMSEIEWLAALKCRATGLLTSLFLRNEGVQQICQVCNIWNGMLLFLAKHIVNNNCVGNLKGKVYLNFLTSSVTMHV